MPCYSCLEDRIHVRMVVDRFSISVTKVVLDDILSALSRSLPEYNVEPAVSRGGGSSQSSSQAENVYPLL